MWGYGQCLDNINGIVNELNSLFSMLIELMTNDSLFTSATTAVPDLVSMIKGTSLTLCVMFFLIDFFTKTLHLQWITWENVMMLAIKLVVAKVCVDNSEFFTNMIYSGFNSFVDAIAGTIFCFYFAGFANRQQYRRRFLEFPTADTQYADFNSRSDYENRNDNRKCDCYCKTF